MRSLSITMKISELKNRLRKDRHKTKVTLSMPEDVVNDLKRIAPVFGFSGYEPLIRYYVGQGLRVDLERLNNLPMQTLIENLKRQCVDKVVIDKALEDIGQQAFSHPMAYQL